MKEDDLVCYETDKTGKFTLDTLENYSNKMEKHIKNDEIINEKKLKTIENKMNNHLEDWMKITKAGEKHNQVKRVKGNLKRIDNQIPVLRGTNKDHKKAEDVEIGSDLRPIMGVMVGPNVGLSEMGSILVRAITNASETGYEIKSTEEMLHKFEEYNRMRKELRVEGKNIIVGSMDINKFYPSIIPEGSGKSIRRVFGKSKVKLEGLEVDPICKYLGKHLTAEEIEEEGFGEILYIKIKKTKKIKKKAAVKKKTGGKYNKKTNKKGALKIKGKTNNSPHINLSGDRDILDTKAGGNKEVLDTIVEGEAKQKRNHKDKENGSNKKNEN